MKAMISHLFSLFKFRLVNAIEIHFSSTNTSTHSSLITGRTIDKYFFKTKLQRPWHEPEILAGARRHVYYRFVLYAYIISWLFNTVSVVSYFDKCISDRATKGPHDISHCFKDPCEKSDLCIIWSIPISRRMPPWTSMEFQELENKSVTQFVLLCMGSIDDALTI